MPLASEGWWNSMVSSHCFGKTTLFKQTGNDFKITWMKVCIWTVYQQSYFLEIVVSKQMASEINVLHLLLELNTLGWRYFICEGHFKFSKPDQLFPELSKIPWMKPLVSSELYASSLTHFTATVQKAYNTLSHWRKRNTDWNQSFQTHYISVSSWGLKMGNLFSAGLLTGMVPVILLLL